MGAESIAVRDWEEFDTHCRGTDLPGRHRNAGAWHGAGVADWPHVRPRRGRCGVERLVQWGICARLPQGAGSDLRPPLSGSRGYQRLQHGLRICQYSRARKPGVEGATATFLAQFAAHAAGHDACTGFCRGVRTGESLKSRVRQMSILSCASCPGAACAFHQKGTVSRGEQTVRQSAPRAVKSHITCSAFVTRCTEAMLRASWKKTVGYCWRTQKCRLVG